MNEIIWGKGLPTYERVNDPRSSLSIYKTDKTYTSDDGKELPLNYHYYYPISSEYTVIAYRREKDYKVDFRYALLTDKEYDAAALALLFPAEQGAEESYYAELYADEKSGKRAYSIPFTEKEYDFYYTAADPEDYDYVLADSQYNSVDSIKAYIRTVYDEKYADSLDSVELIMAFEEEFGAAIPEEDAEKLTTVGKVVECLKAKGYGDDGSAPAQ